MTFDVKTQEQEMREFLQAFDYSNDYEVRYIPKEKPLAGTVAYLTIKEMAELSQTVNDAAVVLMTYYFRKVKSPKFDFFNDAAVGKALGWTTKKTQTTRQKLCTAGWLKRKKFTQSTTKEKITMFYVGKEICDLVETAEEYSARTAQEQA